MSHERGRAARASAGDWARREGRLHAVRLHEARQALAHVFLDGGSIKEVATEVSFDSLGEPASGRCLSTGRRPWGAAASLAGDVAGAPASENDLAAARRAIERTTGRRCTERDLRAARRQAEDFARSHARIIEAVAAALGAAPDRRLSGRAIMEIILRTATSEQLANAAFGGALVARLAHRPRDGGAT